MQNQHQYPLNIASITPEWLTSVLKGKLFEDEETVIEFIQKRLGEGQGFMSEIYRLTLTLSSSKTTTVVVKLPNSMGKTTGSSLDFYSTEVYFYSYYQINSGRKCPLAIPKCYFVASDLLLNIQSEDGKPNATNFCILMEDCHPSEVGDQVKGLSIEEVEKALLHLAKFHANWWKTPKEILEDPEIRPWVSNQSLTQLWAPLVKMSYPGFISYIKKFLFPSGIDPIVQDVGDMLHDVLSDGQSYKDHLTVIHGDFRPDNMMFLRQTIGESDNENEKRKVEEFYTVDFQTLHLGHPMEDVSYLLSCGLTPDVLKENQDHLLHVYLDALTSAREDIKYTFEEAKNDYREYLMYTLLLPILTSNSLMRQLETDSGKLTDQQQRTKELMEGWIHRITAALIHNDPRDILPDISKRHSSACVKVENELDKSLDVDYKGITSYMNTILPSQDWETHEVEKSRATLAGYVHMIEDQKKNSAYDQVGELIDHVIELNDRKIEIRIYSPTIEQKLNAKNENNDRVGFYFHSGWVNGQGCGRLDDLNIRKWVSTSGRPIVTFDHRLAPEFSHDEIVDDCLQVFMWIIDNNSAEILKMSKVKEVVLIGLYQGANLAAKVSFSAISLNLSKYILKQVLLFPYFDPICESESMKLFDKRSKMLEKGTCAWSWKNLLQIPLGDPHASEKLEKFANDPKVNLLLVDDVTLSKIPKTIVLLPEQTVLRDEVNEFVEKVKRVGGEINLHLFSGVGDGFFMNMIEKGRVAINEVASQLSDG